MISQIKNKTNGKIIESIKDNFGNIIYEGYKLLSKIGIPPLSINSNGDDLINYKIYGNVGGVGDKTKNLVDFYDAFVNYDYIHSSNNISYRYIQLEPDTAYILTTNAETTYTLRGVATYQIFIASGQSNTVTGANNGVAIDEPRIVTTDANGYLTIAVRRADGEEVVTEEDITNGIKWIMLNEGSTATEYEPYGYKIPVKVNEDIIEIYLNNNLLENDCVSFQENNLPQLSLQKGVNIIDVNTNIKPSNMEVIYKGKP